MTDGKPGSSMSTILDATAMSKHDRILFSSPLTPGMSLSGLNADADGNESLSDFLTDQSLTDFSEDVEKAFGSDSVCVPGEKAIPVKQPKSVKTARGYGPKKNVQKKRFHCTVENCQYSTPYSKDLARHMRKHTGEKPFECQKCSKTFSRYDKLKTHMMTHDGIRPYKCDVCSYASVDSGSLRKHLRTHTNERPYKCQLCPYQARDSSQLVVHLRHHTGDTPYICTHKDCKAAFKTPSDLQRHFRLHTGEKPYACPHCTYRAAVKCNLTVHIRKVHKGQVCDTNGEVVLLVSSVEPSTVSDTSILKDTYLSSMDTLEELHNNFKVMADSDSYNLEEQPQNVTLANAQSQAIIINSIPNQPISVGVSKPPTKVSRRKPSHSKSTKLPFQYACKACPAKCDTIKTFKNHVVSVHKDSSILPMVKHLEAEAKSVIVNSHAAPTKKRVLKTEVVKLFECNFCPASFAREDSLRCHLRQHSNSDLTATRSALPSSPFSAMTASSGTGSSVLPQHHVMNVMNSHSQVLPVSSHSPFSLSTSDLTVDLNVLGINNFPMSNTPTTLLPPSVLPVSEMNSLANPELPIIVRSETAVIGGQTQNVYVIVRNEKVPDNKQQ